MYRIEWTAGVYFARNRKNLLDWLKLLKDEIITEIRREYKNGKSESVIETYAKYIRR